MPPVLRSPLPAPVIQTPHQMVRLLQLVNLH